MQHILHALGLSVYCLGPTAASAPIQLSMQLPVIFFNFLSRFS